MLVKYTYFYPDLNLNISNEFGNKIILQALLNQDDFNVPNGFGLSNILYKDFIKFNNLEILIVELLKDSSSKNLKKIRELFENGSFSNSMLNQLQDAYNKIKSNKSLVVRSSATYEDSLNLSCAGQHDSYLFIHTFDEMIKSIKKVFSSIFTERAIEYRITHNISLYDVSMAVLVQEMIESTEMFSGVMFTVDPTTGFESYVIQAVSGIGENLVQGTSNADEYMIDKRGLKNGFEPIITKTIVHQKPTLSNSNVINLSNIAQKLESWWQKHFNELIYLDSEWVYDANQDLFYIVQVRPETIYNSKKKSFDTYTTYIIEDSKKPLASGIRCGQAISNNIAFVASTVESAYNMPDNAILITEHTTPDWLPIMKRASGIITEHGSTTCHAAIVARELKIPAILGVLDITKKELHNKNITIACTEGSVGYIYENNIKYKKEEKIIGKKKKIDVPIYAILADPNKALEYTNLPFDGVGLVRLEFLLNNIIGIHPCALLNLEHISKEDQKLIKDKMGYYQNPKDFFIETLARGIAKIGYAFYEKPVIIRTSDFKTNEYSKLIGGSTYEFHEENPMIGFRGAARYIDPKYEEAFRLECKAFCYARDILGAQNINIMIPFVRTVDEIKKVRIILEEENVINKKDITRLYMMVEVPSNILLLEDFAEYVDGFSIGSNDLMQLTLGIDRDSSLNNSYSVLDKSLITFLEIAIKKAQLCNKPIGICGQAPSENIEFAKFLESQRINSISVDMLGIFNLIE